MTAVILVIAILCSTPAAATIARTDTAVTQSRTTLTYHVIKDYNQNDGRTEKQAIDTDGSTRISNAEEAAYVANLTASLLGNQTGSLWWDSKPASWTNLTVSTVNLAGSSVDNKHFYVFLDGQVNLTSDSGFLHTASLFPPASTSATLTFTLSVPSNWSIVGFSGFNATSQSNTSVGGTIASGDIAFVQVSEPTPPAPPNDTTPPVLSAGPNQTVRAGDSTALNGTATDDDPGFPSGASFWWSFFHNGTPVNLSGRTAAFIFWTPGTYDITFTGVDRSGNRAEAFTAILVLSPDDLAPALSPPAAMTVLAGSAVTIHANATDNDPFFPKGARFAWNFTYNGTAVSIGQENLTFTFWTLGNYTLSLWASDYWGNQATASVRVSVESPDQIAPTISLGPDVVTVAGRPVWVAANVTDNDPNFPLGGSFLWAFTYNSTSINLPSSTFAFTFWTLGDYTLTFTALDGWGNRAQASVRVTVDTPDQVAPEIAPFGDQTAAAGSVLTLIAQVSDNDPSFPQGARFWWTYMHNGTLSNQSGTALSATFWTLGPYTLTFVAVDAWGNRAEAVVQLTVVSPDGIAPIAWAGADISANAGSTVALHGSATDNDPGFDAGAAYWWTFTYANASKRLEGKDVPFQFDETGEYTVTLWVRDPWGNVGSDTAIVSVLAPSDGPGPAQSSVVGAELLLPVSLVGLALASILGLVAYRRFGSAAARAQAPLEQAAPVAAEKARPPYFVEGVLILYKDGRLIHHQTAAEDAQIESPEVIGAMFTAVTEFIRDSFGKAGALSRLSYGRNTILLDRSPHLFGATIVYGDPDAALRELLRDTLVRIESAYTGMVETWNGDQHGFHGIEALVAPLIASTQAVSRADVRAASADKRVKVLSGTEHFKGYLRLKIAVVNNTEAKISDAAITVVFNERVLRLARVEPATLEHQAASVRLGDVGPGERVGAVYYLDPLACNETNIDGIVTFRGADGFDQTAAMKTRKAEIVCPVFFTREHANAATLRRLVETSLSARDSKAYRVLSLPAGFSFHDMFTLACEVVQQYDIKVVRSFTDSGPFLGKAWFYGQTRNTKTTVIIRVTVSEERRAVEFFVATDANTALTGLLAEFNRSFMEFVKSRAKGAKIEPVLDDALKGLLSADEF